MTTASKLNQERAERGQMIVDHYGDAEAGSFTKLLTDLAAYAATQGFNWEGATHVARQRVVDEQAETEGREALAALRASGLPS